ncbi:MAG: HpcH/HpaI aldolase/citrate lyase family protein [Firmicutes bacterium]|nr:HpcH/HpaI aldolase/citrate lyase family protein [Bacillota bacterium]
MQYFNYLTEEERQEIFAVPPKKLTTDIDKKTIAYALGAALYMPADSPKVADKLVTDPMLGLVTTVLCLEDAVGDNAVEKAEKNLQTQLAHLLKQQDNGRSLPFIFIRVRNVNQLKRLAKNFGSLLSVLTGFVLPKFEAETGRQYFEELTLINQNLPKPLYGMPILESPRVIDLKTRVDQMLKIKEVLDQYQHLVLNVRIGATDLSGLFGIRRSYEFTIYDIAVIRDCISDIINVFGKPNDGYVISGPVWEYFGAGTRVLKPQLRRSPFQERYGDSGLDFRKQLISQHLDGLIREVMLDKANGLVGKTIIHPSHLAPVQALYAVTMEEYLDAVHILENNNGGVAKSAYQNKMNEAKPHTNWANKIITLARIYGVINENHDYTSIICAREEEL